MFARGICFFRSDRVALPRTQARPAPGRNAAAAWIPTISYLSLDVPHTGRNIPGTSRFCCVPMLQALVVRFSFCFFLCSAILLIGSAAFAQRPKVLAPHVPVAPKMARRHPLAPSTLQSAVGG